MPDDGFGSGLWKNLQAVRFGRDRELEVPVRADGSEGIVVGVDAVEAADASAGQRADGERPGLVRRLRSRLRRR